MDNVLPTGKLSRGKVVGKALLKIGAKKTKRFATNGDKTQNHEEIADIIFDALGVCRTHATFYPSKISKLFKK